MKTSVGIFHCKSSYCTADPIKYLVYLIQSQFLMQIGTKFGITTTTVWSPLVYIMWIYLTSHTLYVMAIPCIGVLSGNAISSRLRAKSAMFFPLFISCFCATAPHRPKLFWKMDKR